MSLISCANLKESRIFSTSALIETISSLSFPDKSSIFDENGYKTFEHSLGDIIYGLTKSSHSAYKILTELAANFTAEQENIETIKQSSSDGVLASDSISLEEFKRLLIACLKYNILSADPSDLTTCYLFLWAMEYCSFKSSLLLKVLDISSEAQSSNVISDPRFLELKRYVNEKATLHEMINHVSLKRMS
ncbi:hypothetical protein DSO57_1024282 [Entomophthora muscae]|uniref:Uncharacterized protein n=1 Tax=Entomophthora muscae TaxID=34485 RepID=A0ACC2RTM5_9FUNG|nr:hypothetical protein DSO57_1024282 [Entomophthora muscae]